jgi:CARDB protein
MPRLTRHLVLAATLAAAMAPGLIGAPAGQAATPSTSAKVVECFRGPTAEQRQATFRAGMAKVAGTSRMSVRLTLEESVAGGPFKAVSAPGLGVWRKSRTGVRAFAYRQRVKALAEGSAYRVRIQYRWHKRDGSVFKTAQRRSKACRQTDPLPNLRVQRIGGRAADAPGRVRYAISVSNRGAAPAPATRVLLWVDGVVAGRAAVPPLAAGQNAIVFLIGSKCDTGLGAQADSDQIVRESDETDNVRSAACPTSQ